MDRYASLAKILKAEGSTGEGSRGGNVVGHTSTGKPIYGSASHEGHSEFNPSDHKDAMNFHMDAAEAASEKISDIKQKNPEKNIPQAVYDFIQHHRQQAQFHQARMTKKEEKTKKSGNKSPFYVGLVVANARGEILLGKREEDGIWTGPGGGADPMESPSDAAIREAYEEANLHLTEFQLAELPTLETKDGKLCHCFLAYVGDDQEIHPDNDPDNEVLGWTWYSIDNLPEGANKDVNRITTINNARMRMKGLKKSEVYMNDEHGNPSVETSDYSIDEAASKQSPWLEYLSEKMKDYEYGQSPVDFTIGDFHHMSLVKVDDGLYSGLVKKRDEDGLEENVLRIEKLTLPTVVQFLRAKEVIPHDDVQLTSDETGKMYAAEMNRMGEELARQEAESLGEEYVEEPPEGYPQESPEEEQDAHGMFELLEILRELKGVGHSGDININFYKGKDKIPGGLADKKKPSDFPKEALKEGIKVEMEHTSDPQVALEIAMDHLMEDLDYYKKLKLVEKARKPMPVGTVRVWGGQKYVKHSDGWVAMGGKHHGKVMGKFKEEPTHHEFASEHHKKQEEPPKESSKESPKREEPKKEGLTEQQKQYREKNKRLLDRAENSGALEMSQDAYVNYRRKENVDRIMDMYGDRYSRSQVEASVKRKRSATKRWKEEHEALVHAAVRAGMPVKKEALDSYPGLGGKLPEGLDNTLNEKTNMIQSVDLGKSSKKIKKEFAGMLNECNQIVAEMGIRFKTPIAFKATNLGKLGKRTRGTYNEGKKTITLKDMSAASKTLMHEIGHAIDYAMAEESRKGRHSENILKVKHKPEEASELEKLYGELHDVVTNSDYYKHADPSFRGYLLDPTEVFARGFEVYSLVKAEKMGLSGQFMDTFLPDVMKTKDPEIITIKEELQKVRAAASAAKDQEESKKYMSELRQLREKWNKKIEQTTGGFVPVPKEKQEEYKKKIAGIMEKIFQKDEIRKAIKQVDLAAVLRKSEIFQKGKAKPIGTISTWHGKKFIKQGEGHWVPYQESQQGQQAQPQGQDQQQVSPSPTEATAPQQQEETSETLAGVEASEDISHLEPGKEGEGGEVTPTAEDLKALLERGPYSVISAGVNPADEKDKAMTEEQVQERYKQLEEDLKQKGYKYSVVDGNYDGEEKLYMVFHANPKEINELGKKYNQDSVIHTKGGQNEMVFTSGDDAGKHHKGEGYEEVPDADNYYSVVRTKDGKEVKFSMGFDFDKTHE